MMSSNEIFERARLSRDARFDGRFFIGVKTTGIYCRPICPATAPKSENVAYYTTAAAASEAGFRPCLRCRPECAPGTPAWAGTSTTVHRGLRLIAQGALDDGNLEQLADRLGVTSRHLRRLFGKHLGASPLAVAHTQRLHFAKNLIDQTSLSMKDISIASGFGSVRRFNDTFKKTYGRTPGELRRRRDTIATGSAFSVQLPYRRPFNWNGLLTFFAARATPGVEAVQGARYFRTVVIGDEHGILEVQDSADHLLLSLHGVGTNSLFSIVQRARGLFDLDAPADEIARVLSADSRLKALLKKNTGVRVPGSWDGFELTVRAILGQQVSVSAATTLAGRIANRYGERIGVSIDGLPEAPDRLFPEPQKLVRARLEKLGIIASRASTIRSVARAVVDGTLSFDAAASPDDFCESLQSIRGIGDWTAQYVAMRALKNPDAFPASDLGLLRAFDRPGKARMRPGELKNRAEAWRPWRAYAALLLWGSAAGAGG
ncbi:MAG: helix-turn-helix domain-containing protein [Gammaproteobacteria bacterium]|nr:helix-turn-helix domain-containing protein [Gammaproteobacteria bacterium]NNL45949.1 DNA-3-methyladenine glycosylase 2 family protein [Woeseiaceae bacterium]